MSRDLHRSGICKLTLGLLCRNFCHTARLPAEARYLGVMTESNNEIGFPDYYKGVQSTEAHDNVTRDEGNMQLVYDPVQRQDCPIELHHRDFKDWFYVHVSVDCGIFA